MTTLAIRPATLADKASIESILAEAYTQLLEGYYAPDILRRATPLIARANPGLLSSGRYFLALRGERAVACGGWSHEAPGGQRPSTKEGEAHLRHFATRPEAIGAGAGRMIVERCEAAAINDGASVMRSQSTLMAEGFYARLGYAHDAFANIDFGGSAFPVVLMVKELGRG